MDFTALKRTAVPIFVRRDLVADDGGIVTEGLVKRREAER